MKIQCSHPKEDRTPYHDNSMKCNYCNEVVEQNGKEIEVKGYFLTSPIPDVNWTHATSTSRDIISYLKGNGHKLANDDIQKIIDETYDLMKTSMEWQSNGCDCGQVNCGTCN